MDADFMLLLLLLVLLAQITVTEKRMKWRQRNASTRLLCHLSTVFIICCLWFNFFFILIEAGVLKKMRMPMLLSGRRFVMDSGIQFWHFASSRISLVWF